MTNSSSKRKCKLTPSAQAERERCAKLVERVAKRFGEELAEGARLHNLVRLIRGVEHASWCQSKYRDPCNCGLVEAT